MAEQAWISVRVMGGPEQQEQMRAVIERIGWGLDVAWDGSFAPNRRDGGSRAFIQVRVPDLDEL